MKKVLALALGTAIALVLAAIFIHAYTGTGTIPVGLSKTTPPTGIPVPAPSGASPAPVTQTSIVQELYEDARRTTGGNNTPGDTMARVKTDVRIKLTFNNEEVIVRMQDNPTTRDFLTLLPLTATLEDYAGTEKIAQLTRRLSTQDAPAGSDPSVGDFAYYSPWGNLAMYYRDFGYSDGLVILGSVEGDGVAKLARMSGDSTVMIERIE